MSTNDESYQSYYCFYSTLLSTLLVSPVHPSGPPPPSKTLFKTLMIETGIGIRPEAGLLHPLPGVVWESQPPCRPRSSRGLQAHQRRDNVPRARGLLVHRTVLTHYLINRLREWCGLAASAAGTAELPHREELCWLPVRLLSSD